MKKANHFEEIPKRSVIFDQLQFQKERKKMIKKKKRGNIKQMILENFPHLKTDLHLQIKEVAEFKLRSVGKDTPKHI